MIVVDGGKDIYLIKKSYKEGLNYKDNLIDSIRV